MKKVFSILLVVCALGVVLTGCGEKAAEGEATTTTGGTEAPK